MGRRLQTLALWGIVLLAAAAVRADGPATGPHARLDCDRCHRSRAAASAARLSGPEDACRSCHRPAGDRRDFHLGAPRCASCHTIHGDAPVASETDRSLEHCAGCHRDGEPRPSVSRAHEAAAELLYHRPEGRLTGQDPAQGCLLCHGRDEAALAQAGDAPRFHRHESHPLGVEARPASAFHLRPAFDPRIRLEGGRIGCITCHDLRSGRPDHLVDFGAESAYELCRGCHRHEGSQGGGSPALVRLP